MSRPRIEPVTFRFPKWTLYLLTYQGQLCTCGNAMTYSMILAVKHKHYNFHIGEQKACIFLKLGDCSILVNWLTHWVCYPPLFHLIGCLNFENSVLSISKKCPIWVFMNFQLGIFSKGNNDNAQLHKSFTYQPLPQQGMSTCCFGHCTIFQQYWSLTPYCLHNVLPFKNVSVLCHTWLMMFWVI